MKKVLFTAALATSAIMAASPAVAGVTIGSITPGTAVYTGPTPTYDFDPNGSALVSGGSVVTQPNTSGHAQPLGSTGNYLSVGPADGSPGILDLSSIGDIFNISFIWGSVDTYNTLEFLDASNNVLALFTGTDINNPANGDQTAAATNPVVRFDLTGGDVSAFSKLRFTSTSNAFESDNFAINAVPEPATWMMMLFGFGMVGASLRRRNSTRLAQLA